MTFLKTTLFVCLIILLILLFSSMYIIGETQQGLLLRLGRLISDPKTHTAVIIKPGLHFKWPFLEKIIIFDNKLQTFDGQVSQISTLDKKELTVDYYVRWKINNLPLYYSRTNGDNEQTIELLQQQINDRLRTLVGNLSISDIVAQMNSNLLPSLLKEINEKAKALGLELIDIGMLKLDSPALISETLEQMRADQARLAIQYRSEGKAKAEEIRAQADAKVSIILAKATAIAAKLRAFGDAQAAKIYGAAYAADPSFYSFYKSITAYQRVFNSKKDILVIRPQGQFFKYFTNEGVSSPTKESTTTK